MCVEQVSNFGTRERGSNGGGGIDAHNDHSVLQGCHIGNNDVDDVQKAKMAYPVESLGSCICLDVLASGLHYHTEGDEEYHESEAVHSAPDVDDLGDGELGDAAQNRGNDAGGGEEAVLPKG